MNETTTQNKRRIAILGLGYVGLPLAAAFGAHFPTLGFDIDEARVNALLAGTDHTEQLDAKQLQQLLARVQLSATESSLAGYNTYIVTVPTPVDEAKKPDLGPLLRATAMLGGYLKKGDLVIYESTVYPGCTEEACVPLLESLSGLRLNQDFGVGYSPERINPGDKLRGLTNILKVTSGSNAAVAQEVDALYQQIIEAGTYLAPSIRVAEAAKAIENAQRDINISFVNELALIFDRMGLDTQEVLAAAATKWNFLPFKPGLVGGHCIGVDPYYLAYKAEKLGYKPEVILSGRRVNDQMGAFIASKLLKMMLSRSSNLQGARVLVAGFAFKENCPDTRNTRVIDIVNELHGYGLQVDVWDPVADAAEARADYGLELLSSTPEPGYQAVVVAVAHEAFGKFDFAPFKAAGAVIFDVKGLLSRELADARL
ncbi:MAG: nucleotide sugar dehydrogenase [Bacteroidia bacterium]